MVRIDASNLQIDIVGLLVGLSAYCARAITAGSGGSGTRMLAELLLQDELFELGHAQAHAIECDFLIVLIRNELIMYERHFVSKIMSFALFLLRFFRFFVLLKLLVDSQKYFSVLFQKRTKIRMCFLFFRIFFSIS